MTQPRPRVSFVPLQTYDNDEAVAALRETLKPLGGMERFVRPGNRVILKPNLVFGRAPDRAINTHPAILRAAAILTQEAGAAWIGVGDSPGFGSAKLAMKQCGILDVADALGLEPFEFTPSEDVDRDRSFIRLELAKELLEADVIINLPKMKTHGQMNMTLAVKNMFGAVPGARKLQWHYRAGRDQNMFARAINEIARRVRPQLSILDAVVGMDGLGPSAGRVRPVGFIAAGDDPWSLDAAVMDMLGLDRDLLFTLAEAVQSGHIGWQSFERFGPADETLRPADWQIPSLRTLQMHGGFIERRLPRVAAWLRRRITPRPFPKATCIGCSLCVDICPAKAMRLDGGKLHIDEAACIRCFCCHELCQHDGMGVTEPGLVARLLRIR
ncbi:MAG: DUF362 domain-containing protein [Planctomycetaceae bacterium]|nr:DUF362 domain-containing protein [Planctomycetaceae bacterium]